MNGKTMLNGVPYFSDTQVIELTRAEYDALPNSKYTDGVLYCIKDEGVMKGDTFSPIIYSLAEREVGVWTDGKPLYQKTVVIPISSQTGDITLEIATGINVCNAFGIIKTSGGFEMALPASYSNIFYCGLQHDGNYVRLSIYSTSSWQQYNTLTEAIVTIQYTKTTDNPGTGKWTTSGVPVHHYSTEEQVVGTWIDGRTIYERTYVLDTPLRINRDNWTATTFPANSIDMFLRADGQQNGSATAPILAANVNGYINILFNRYNSSETYLTMFTVRYVKTLS